MVSNIVFGGDMTLTAGWADHFNSDHIALAIISSVGSANRGGGDRLNYLFLVVVFVIGSGSHS